MLALRFHPGEPQFILEKDLALPILESDDDVLVKVEFSGMCGTDLHIIQGEFGGCSVVNVTLGHEFSGTVIKCGSNAQNLPLNSKVAIDPNRYFDQRLERLCQNLSF